MLGAVASPLLSGAVPSRLLCMAADRNGIDIHYEAMEVCNMDSTVVAPGPAVGELMGPVAMWNVGISTSIWGTSKRVQVRLDDGRQETMTKRERCLRYIILKFQTSALQVIGLVDNGLHETGVEGLEQELQDIVNNLDPKPGIHIHRHKSYLFLHTRDVEMEHIKWRHLWDEDRLENDARNWTNEGKREEAINNLLKRRHWRGCLEVVVKMPVCNMVRAEGGSYSGGLAVQSGNAQLEKMRARFIFLHSPAGNNDVLLPGGEKADHHVPKNDRAVLREAVTTAICFATERDERKKIAAWAVLGDTNLTMKEVADNSNDVGDVDDDADDDDYAYVRMLCPAACNRK